MGYGTPVDMWSLGVVVYILLCGSPPFAEGEYCDVVNFDRVGREGRRDLGGEDLGGEDLGGEDLGGEGEVSDEAKDFVGWLLRLDPTERPSAEDAMNHEWLVECAMNNMHISPSPSKDKDKTKGDANTNDENAEPIQIPSNSNSTATELPTVKSKRRFSQINLSNSMGSLELPKFDNENNDITNDNNDTKQNNNIKAGERARHYYNT